MNSISNTNMILRYPGAKWRIADWIIERLPPHKSYLEPFFGSGAVFFKKDPSPIETINDLDEDGDVVINPKEYPKGAITITGGNFGKSVFLTREEAEKGR